MAEIREPVGSSETLFAALISQGCSTEHAARIAGTPGTEDFMLREIALTDEYDQCARERNRARPQI